MCSILKLISHVLAEQLCQSAERSEPWNETQEVIVLTSDIILLDV